MKYKVGDETCFEIDHDEYVVCYISKLNKNNTYEIKVPNQESWLRAREGELETHTYDNISIDSLSDFYLIQSSGDKKITINNKSENFNLKR